MGCGGGPSKIGGGCGKRGLGIVDFWIEKGEGFVEYERERGGFERQK